MLPREMSLNFVIVLSHVGDFKKALALKALLKKKKNEFALSKEFVSEANATSFAEKVADSFVNPKSAMRISPTSWASLNYI